MYLQLFVDSTDSEVCNKYSEAIEKHNAGLLKPHIDAGFDLFCPTEVVLHKERVNPINYGVICSAKIMEHTDVSYNTGFYMYPRSSISKSNLRLANNTGIIDAGYRGHLIGMFDVIYSSNEADVKVKKFDRHLQVCAPGLIPMYVELVKSKEALGEPTLRGDNGFGSTGK